MTHQSLDGNAADARRPVFAKLSECGRVLASLLKKWTSIESDAGTHRTPNSENLRERVRGARKCD